MAAVAQLGLAQNAGPPAAPALQNNLVPLAVGFTLWRIYAAGGAAAAGQVPIQLGPFRLLIHEFRWWANINFGPNIGGRMLAFGGADPANPFWRPGSHRYQVQLFFPPGDPRILTFVADLNAARAAGNPLIMHFPAGSMEIFHVEPNSLEIQLQNPRHAAAGAPNAPAPEPGIVTVPPAAAAPYLVPNPPMWF